MAAGSSAFAPRGSTSSSSTTSPPAGRTRRGASGSPVAARSSPTKLRSRSTGASPFPAAGGCRAQSRGAGPPVLGDLAPPVELLHVRVEPSGEDLLLEAYLREP